MTYFAKDGFSSCEVAGAVAEAAIHDLRVNLFTFAGFPQILVADPINDIFSITLIWKQSEEYKVAFELTRAEAKAAAKLFKAGKGYDKNIFKRVQTSLAKLESESKDDGKI